MTYTPVKWGCCLSSRCDASLDRGCSSERSFTCALAQARSVVLILGSCRAMLSYLRMAIKNFGWLQLREARQTFQRGKSIELNGVGADFTLN